MSTDFKSAEQKLNEVLNKFRDVDPDLRFMALNDLNKLLVEHQLILNKVNHYSDQVTTILLEALNDVNTDVQNQSLHCFSPLVGVLEDQEVVKVIDRLREPTTNKSSITTSIQTMAICEVLKNINLKYKTTGALMSDLLLPQVFENTVIHSLDTMEILTVLLQNLGNTISHENLVRLYEVLISTIFKGETIVAKKAIAALGHLSTYLEVSDAENLLQKIHATNVTSYESIVLKLLTYISLVKENFPLFEQHFTGFLQEVFDKLYLDQTDLDDDQIKIDDVRYEALNLVDVLLLERGSLTESRDKILTICKRFLVYDPYSNDMDEDEYDFSDPEFSDEDYDEVDANDDNSWKLRKQSARIITTLIKISPEALQDVYSSGIFECLLSTVADSSDAVSFEKIATLDTIVQTSLKLYTKRSGRKRTNSDALMSDKDEDPLAVLQEHRSEIVDKFITELDAVKNNGSTKYNYLLNFFQNFNELADDLKPLLACVRKHNFGINLDLLKFYSAMLQNNDIGFFGSEFQYIVELVNSGLSNKNHITVTNSMDTAVDLLNLTYNETLTNSIFEIAANAKNDSVVRNNAIQTLGSLKTLPPQKIEELLELLAATLKYDPIAISTIDAITQLAEIYGPAINVPAVPSIVQTYTEFISNPVFLSHTIESLVEISQYTDIDSSIGDSLLKVFENDVYQSQVLRILSHLNYDKQKLQTIFLQAASIDEVDETALLEVSSKIGSDLIPTLEQHSDNPKNIKILANIVINENLRDYVEAKESELAQHINSSFNIRLLGYIGQVMPLTTSIKQLQSFFSEDETKFYAAESLGRLISTNPESYLPEFLERITANQDRCLLLITIKQVLKINKSLPFETYLTIWNTLFDILKQEEVIDEALTRIASQDVGLILVNNSDTGFFYQQASEFLKTDNCVILFTVIAAIKFILAYDNIFTADLVDPLLLQVFAQIENEDLEVKQVSIVTLMTALNNQFTILIPHLVVVLPYVYNELGAKKQYEESIQIGPFKHKIDKALEVRKNAFEILYKLTLNHNLLKNVDFNEVLTNVVNYGLKADIISISSLIIIKLLAFDDVILSPETRAKLSAGIDKLLNSIKKKEDQQKDSKEEQETKATLISLRNEIFQEDYLK
ncbi:ARM repeat-containing protein [Cyberlindnera jadinii NRRL Y-1542]|uniref:ARM repeat-containing protein n=1 Tax=Cyberlindnera jadinii (strain ATCC 18201 / CBS 1600 / BCRC 20928 / JCM 3617 / NBRC 0987 / NRRL Y-1542) TaxID=983966 RepID=A0A1E4S2P0_CYBJN|nr:ARM repeat-containing protein [Cyberlindnera jadinii NRRL Y-1542]ODV73761.1 ARM repeat-containing protein [Cyberlindnera jadinii NRRL Y-1542]